ncbi:MAG TPA: DUF2716 domain-containing protein [Gemmataceae bacterium]|nr:DUF2716 domain-containing protein [Gemmataceae bacterium]
MVDSKLPVDYSARLAIWRGLGWVELSPPEVDAVWDRFEVAFGFFGTGIREPTPSLTWDIGWVFDEEQAFDRLEADFNAKGLGALRACTAPGERVYALDWMHSCFWFDPRGGVASGDPDEWAVPVFPNGDHYVFLARDLRFGFIGQMNTSVCAFGEGLLRALAADPPAACARLLPRDGQLTEPRVTAAEPLGAPDTSRGIG